jgi:hypothetical protein
MNQSEPMNSRNLVLWESGVGGPVAARIAVAGDFLPAGKIELPTGGWSVAAARLADHFKDVAAAFVNLECVPGAEGLRARPVCGIGDIVSAPSASLDYLDALGARIVGTANNHSYDFGAAGVERTRQTLMQRGLIPLGAGHTLRSAPDIFIWEGAGNLQVGFWAAATASHDIATHRTGGVEPATIGRARQAIDAIRARGAHFAIALLHAGCQRASRPDPADAKLMERMARSGFNLVAASHSHRISGCRLVRARQGSPAFCFYGLGSLVSGYTASPLEREGLIVVAGFDSSGTLARVEVRPVFLGATGFGEVPSPELSRTILERFRCLSAEIANGSAKRLFYHEVSRGLLKLYLRDTRAAFRQSGVRGLARKAGRVRPRHVWRAAYRLMG